MSESAVADAPETETDDTVRADLKLEDSGPARKTMVFTVSQDEVKRKIEETYGTLAEDAVLPGFRKGRAPRKLLERKFASSIRGDVKQQIISEAYGKAVEEHELDVLGEPEVRDAETLELPDSGDFSFTIDVEVTPDVSLPEFSSLSVERPEAPVTDDAVEEEIGKLAERFGSMEEVEDFTTQEGDYVRSDLRVLAGEDADDGAEVVAEVPGAYTLLHGEDKGFKGHIAGIVVPDMGTRLVGKRAGHVERISMQGPASHENAAIRDQPVTLVMTIDRVDRMQPIEMSALVERVGMEDEAKLREEVRKMLLERAAGEQRQALHKQLADQLLEKVQLELPDGLKDRQIERNHQRRRMQLLMGGKAEDEIGDELAEARGESEEEAVRQLRAFFIVDAAAKQLEIEVSQNEVNGRIYAIAQQQNARFEKVRQEMGNRGEIEQLYLSIREAKTLDRILESATVTGAEAVVVPDDADAPAPAQA
ncbi:trigger factor [Phycisphaera mikurensis]|uniref:Trigger factor n=1 Tax=Phycisphaera mikurensis (strain NBRC 102666 / KCTC 22515 / FYK2301M01) TaxID=1142394 RepID=I0IEL0_PHYMF|nr:trigger factor [Phycisphaera mikurensis]MBB6441497.1 trigger factor [Phycisphaera mikurensis]BAM03698.1 trigger factor [Phycisphaera mikurensis NBRC 102666]